MGADMSRTAKRWFFIVFIACVAIVVGCDMLAPQLLGGRGTIGKLYLPLGFVGGLGLVIIIVLEIAQGRPVGRRLLALVVIALLFVMAVGLDLGPVAKSVLRIAAAVQHHVDQVRFARAADGRFHVKAAVDGVDIDFVAESEGRDTMLTPEDARRLGIDVSSLTFNVPIGRGDSTETAAFAQLKRLEVGPLVATDLQVLVSSTGESGNVLGKLFFMQFKDWYEKDDTLTVQY